MHHNLEISTFESLKYKMGHAIIILLLKQWKNQSEWKGLNVHMNYSLKTQIIMCINFF